MFITCNKIVYAHGYITLRCLRRSGHCGACSCEWGAK